MAYMFNGLKSIKELDLSNFSTSKVTDASCMFLNCKKIKSLDLSSFDTINLTDTNSMFSGCDSLESVNMSNWSFKNCTYCGSAVFNSMGLSKIKSLDLENATYYGDLRYTFENLLELEELNLKNFKNINTTKLYYTFNRLEKIKHLDVSYIDTSEVTEPIKGNRFAYMGYFKFNFNAKYVFWL